MHPFPFFFLCRIDLLTQYTLCMNCLPLCWYKTDVIVTLTFLPSFTFVCLSSSLSFFLSFLIDTKRQAVCAYIHVALSRFVCSVLDGSVSLCALLIFLPPYRIRLCVCARVRTRVCAFASLYALCLCQLLILYKHTHTHERTSARAHSLSRLRTHTHTHTYRR
jgi:hypothetical protein